MLTTNHGYQGCKPSEMNTKHSSSPPNYKDHEYYCGGSTIQGLANEGRGGVEELMLITNEGRGGVEA